MPPIRDDIVFYTICVRPNVSLLVHASNYVIWLVMGNSTDMSMVLPLSLRPRMIKTADWHVRFLKWHQYDASTDEAMHLW